MTLETTVKCFVMGEVWWLAPHDGTLNWFFFCPSGRGWSVTPSGCVRKW